MDIDVDWLSENVADIHMQHIAMAEAHQLTLTKPPGSLGRMESIAVQFCGWQGVLKPTIDNIYVRVFAADHGVCEQGVSAFPQSVTAQMIANFISGGAAISVLSEQMNADFAVVNLGTVDKISIDSPKLIDAYIAPQTNDFSVQAAMSNEQLTKALDVGRKQIDGISADLFIGGEMGIGNTSSAAALFAALLELTADQVCGPGTGLDQQGVNKKSVIIANALTHHNASQLDVLEILKTFGGFEIAALCAAYLRCAQQGIPVLVDGYICTAAALVAIQIHPGAQSWFLFSHQSGESAHGLILEKMGVNAIVNLGLRLGEGSGAAVVVPLLRSAIALHNNMATFEAAGVSEQV